MVDLVDGDQDRDFGGAGVIEGLEGLGHHAIVGGDHEHDNIRDVGPAGAHRAEGRVAGRVEEGDLRQFIFPLRMRK